jgi:hypothetical protein
MSDEKDKPQVTLPSNSNGPPANHGNWSMLDGKPLVSPPDLDHTPQRGDDRYLRSDLYRSSLKSKIRKASAQLARHRLTRCIREIGSFTSFSRGARSLQGSS